MESESLPDDWKVANVVPVHKGGSRNVTTNYRPISLTSQLCKIFDTLVRDQVSEFLESNQLIKDTQHGFRKGSSFYSAPQCSHCKRCTSYSNSVRLSVSHTPVLCQNDST